MISDMTIIASQSPAALDAAAFRAAIRDVADFPSPGITFRDVTPLLADPGLLRRAARALRVTAAAAEFGSVAGIESRGFIFAAAVAAGDGPSLGLHILRKPGGLPPPVLSRSYALEYGSDTLELRDGLIRPGERVLLIDDVLATGGTAGAAVQLLKSAGAVVVGAAFLIELDGLGGRAALEAAGVPTTSVLKL